MLSETSLEHFDFHGWSNALIENVVNRVEYRHVHVVVTIDFLDTLRAVVSFGNHLHFELGGLDGITLSNHGAEHTVSGEVGIHGHEQVAQIDGVGDAPFAWLHALKKAVHFLHGIRHQHGLEVVAQLESVADARCDGIDILQYGTIFNAFNVGADRSLDEFSCQDIGNESQRVTVHQCKPLGPQAR